EGASLFTNIGRAFRAPTAFELFSNGVHEGTSTFENGNASLKEETSLMAELGFKLKSNDFTMNITGYTNKIENYIFSSPTGTFFTDIGGSVYPEYSTTQGNATIYGIEADAEYTLTEWLAFLGGGDFIRGRNDSLNEALPLIPANRFHAGVTFTGKKIMGILNPYLQMKARYTARKSELSNDEKRLYSSFADYALLSLKTGGDFAVGSALWTYTLGVDNLLNQKYVDYLSRQKLFTLNPGINVYFKITAPIDLIH
ncbi:MAG TPA: TonB-dependent receptor, partial [Turneriella sp.]|nr:TonB-dependent receptor [Turneriella sp.]